MKNLFIKLYTASIVSILIAMSATFYLLLYQWQPENNYNLKRFSEPALYELVSDLKATSLSSREEWLNMGGHELPMSSQELSKLRELSSQMTLVVSLIFKKHLVFSSAEQELLNMNQIVYHNNMNMKVAYLSYDEERVLELELTRLKGNANHWMASLIYLLHYSKGSLETKLTRIKDSLYVGEEPKVSSLADSKITSADLARLLVRPIGQSPITSAEYTVRFLYFPNQHLIDPQIVEVAVLLSPTLFPPIIFLPIISLLIGLALWITLSPYASKACSLSMITQRFGEGDLQARVRLKGNGPIESLAQQFDQAADHVVGLIRAQEGLLKGVAHELRTPIARLYFYGDLLSNETDSERRAQLLTDFNNNVAELTDLTDELLSNHRYKSGKLKLDFSPVNLTQVVNDVCRESLELQVALRLRVECEKDQFILGELKPIKRMIGNLVTNASRYGNKQIQVTLRSSKEEEKGDQSCVELWVEDDGEGIPDEQKKEIFNPFVRLDESRNRHTGGIGLGLSICHAIVKALGGTLSVETSETLGGANFVVKLPTTHPNS